MPNRFVLLGGKHCHPLLVGLELVWGPKMRGSKTVIINIWIILFNPNAPWTSIMIVDPIDILTNLVFHGELSLNWMLFVVDKWLQVPIYTSANYWKAYLHFQSDLIPTANEFNKLFSAIYLYVVYEGRKLTNSCVCKNTHFSSKVRTFWLVVTTLKGYLRLKRWFWD